MVTFRRERKRCGPVLAAPRPTPATPQPRDRGFPRQRRMIGCRRRQRSALAQHSYTHNSRYRTMQLGPSDTTALHSRCAVAEVASAAKDVGAPGTGLHSVAPRNFEATPPAAPALLWRARWRPACRRILWNGAGGARAARRRTSLRGSWRLSRQALPLPLPSPWRSSRRRRWILHQALPPLSPSRPLGRRGWGACAPSAFAPSRKAHAAPAPGRERASPRGAADASRAWRFRNGHRARPARRGQDRAPGTSSLATATHGGSAAVTATAIAPTVAPGPHGSVVATGASSMRGAVSNAPSIASRSSSRLRRHPHGKHSSSRWPWRGRIGNWSRYSARARDATMSEPASWRRSRSHPPPRRMTGRRGGPAPRIHDAAHP